MNLDLLWTCAQTRADFEVMKGETEAGVGEGELYSAK